MLSFFKRSDTAQIKGIALIFMFLHHFFTFPSWHSGTITYAWSDYFAKHFQQPFKLCVPIFAFLTGYFYFSAKKKTISYSVRKITEVLIPFWLILFPLMLISAALGSKYSFANIILQCFALERPIMVFCWYVSFYITTILFLPMLTKCLSNRPVGDIIIGIILPVAAFSCICAKIPEGYVHDLSRQMADWFPIVMAGYFCAEYEVFENYSKQAEGRSKAVRIIAWILLMVVPFLLRYYLHTFSAFSTSFGGTTLSLSFTWDMIYAPCFVYGAKMMLGLLPDAKITVGLRKVLSEIGKHSLSMWYLHCIFFNDFKKYTQRFLYFAKNPVLVLVTGLILCYAAAVCVDFLAKKVLQAFAKAKKKTA